MARRNPSTATKWWRGWWRLDHSPRARPSLRVMADRLAPLECCFDAVPRSNPGCECSPGAFVPMMASSMRDGSFIGRELLVSRAPYTCCSYASQQRGTLGLGHPFHLRNWQHRLVSDYEPSTSMITSRSLHYVDVGDYEPPTGSGSTGSGSHDHIRHGLCGLLDVEPRGSFVLDHCAQYLAEMVQEQSTTWAQGCFWMRAAALRRDRYHRPTTNIGRPPATVGALKARFLECGVRPARVTFGHRRRGGLDLLNATRCLSL